jgi:3-oxoacyl-[acyl-carrier protein] reductase
MIHGRSQEAAECAAAEVRGQGVRSAVYLADVRDAAACAALPERAWSVWNGLDVLVSNAGADILTGEAASWPFERKLQELLAVDVTATVLLCRDLGQRMKAAGNGVIVTLGWDQAETGMEGEGGQLFGAAKGAIISFTRSLAATLAPEVRVNCLAPGWIRTGWAESASAAWQERAVRESLLRRWGTPGDVAAVALWLVSDAAAFVTGQVIRVNGGAAPGQGFAKV